MAKFRRDDRVKVTNQHSQFRNALGTVMNYAGGLVRVKLDGGSRYERDPPLFAERDLGRTSFTNPHRPIESDEFEE